MSWDPVRAASFYDEYGESEWTRFEDGRTPAPSLDVHLQHLRRFVRAGDRVLDVGAGPGRFTIELARIGADVAVADLSPRQLELNRERVAARGLEKRILDRQVADVLDLSHWEDECFDATVCFLRAFLSTVELELAREPGALSCGQHILAVVRRPA